MSTEYSKRKIAAENCVCCGMPSRTLQCWRCTRLDAAVPVFERARPRRVSREPAEDRELDFNN